MSNADTYREIADIVLDAKLKITRGQPNPIGAGQDLEDAAARLAELNAGDRHSEMVEQIHRQLRLAGSFAQDYQGSLARQASFANRLQRLANWLDDLASPANPR